MTLNNTNYGYLLSKETLLIIFLFKVWHENVWKRGHVFDNWYSWVISKNIGIEFGMDKCIAVRIKQGKICYMVDINMPDEQRMKNIEESEYNYLVFI